MADVNAADDLSCSLLTVLFVMMIMMTTDAYRVVTVGLLSPYMSLHVLTL